MFAEKYVLLLEGRVFSIIYRSNWLTNIFSIKFYIDLNLFYVNSAIVRNVNKVVNIGDVISVDSAIINILKYTLL